MRRFLLSLAALTTLGGCAYLLPNLFQRELPGFTPSAPRTAWIVAADGTRIGQASFMEAAHGVLIRLEFSEHALPPGWHGVHLHRAGDCGDFAAGFQAAGAHAGHAENVEHGFMNAAGPEAGDLPNLFAALAGPFGAEFYSTAVTLGPAATEDGRLPLLDGDGAALVVHEGQDNHSSQPIGGAGPRIACAALTQTP